jgi:hypothetical protein
MKKFVARIIFFFVLICSTSSHATDTIEVCEDIGLVAATTFIHFADQMPNKPQPISFWLGNAGQTAAELYVKKKGGSFHSSDPAVARLITFFNARILKELHDNDLHEYVSSEEEKKLMVIRAQGLCMAFSIKGDFKVNDQYIIDERKKWRKRTLLE